MSATALEERVNMFGKKEVTELQMLSFDSQSAPIVERIYVHALCKIK